jgi:hypothetical protein
MDGWMDGRTDGRTDRQTERQKSLTRKIGNAFRIQKKLTFFERNDVNLVLIRLPKQFVAQRYHLQYISVFLVFIRVCNDY